MSEVPQYQPPQGQQPYVPYGQQKTGTNTLAIISLIASFFISLLGVILGFVALNQIKRTGESGRGLALAGIIIGFAGIAIGLLVFIIGMAGVASSGTHY